MVFGIHSHVCHSPHATLVFPPKKKCLQLNLIFLLFFSLLPPPAQKNKAEFWTWKVGFFRNRLWYELSSKMSWSILSLFYFTRYSSKQRKIFILNFLRQRVRVINSSRKTPLNTKVGVKVTKASLVSPDEKNNSFWYIICFLRSHPFYSFFFFPP